MKRKIKGILFFLLLLSLLVIFPFPTSRETVLNVTWEDRIVTGYGGDEPLSDPVLPFTLNGSFGYVDTEGNLSPVYPIHYGVALTDDRYISYANVQNSLVVRDRDGAVAGMIENSGYPIYHDGRLFLIATDRMGITEATPDGDILWTREFSSVISSFDSSGDACGVGLLNGRFHLIDAKGADIFSYETSGSRVLAVYGCAVSSDNSLIGIVSGLDPQRLVVLENRNSAYKPVRGFNLDHQYRKRVFIDFSPDGTYLYYESPAGLNFLEVKGKKEAVIPFSGRLSGLILSGPASVSGLISRGENTAELCFFSPEGTVIYDRVLGGTDPFMGTLSGLFILGTDDMLAAVSAEVR